jgi:calcium/calmodulin-dependent protein kinase I
MSADKTSNSVFTGLMNEKFIQKDLAKMPTLHKFYAATYFTLYTTKEKSTSIKVYCELWDYVILIKESPSIKPMGFMDISYARLKLTVNSEGKRLRLIKNRKYEELWSEDEDVLNQWYEMLGKFCVYSNFRADFDIQTLLGKGNFAKVYLVEQKSTKKQFSAKIFDKELIKTDPFEMKCFLYEIMMLREVDGPNLLYTYRFYEGESNIYCVGQYCSGGTIYEFLKQHGSPTENHSISILRQVLECLVYLHSKGLIHRDLKPENIIFNNNSYEKVTLVDFGFMTKAKEYKLLFTRCGTPGYVAPEVLADQDYDTAADMYSAGILFYALITKKNPFQNKSYSKLIKNNKSGSVDYTIVEDLKLENKSASKI